MCDLYSEPETYIKIKHDKVVTLIYSQERFKLKDNERKAVDDIYKDL